MSHLPHEANVEPLFPFGLYSRKWGLRVDDFRHGCGRVAQPATGLAFELKWKGKCLYLYEAEIHDLWIGRRMKTLDAILADDRRNKLKSTIVARIVRALTKAAPTRREQFQQVIAKTLTNLELEQHRRNGHPTVRAACPECRAGGIRQRPHRRLPDRLRPGGDLSIDMSGPHLPGRWPSDALEAQARRAQHFIIGYFRCYTEEELVERDKNKMFAGASAHAVPKPADIAAEAAGPSAKHSAVETAGASTDQAKQPKMLYYFRPLQTKRLEETVPAIQSIVAQINEKFRCHAVWRIHGDGFGVHRREGPGLLRGPWRAGDLDRRS